MDAKHPGMRGLSGLSSDEVRCPKCGRPNPWDRTYCMRCGAVLEGYYRRELERYTQAYLRGRIRGVRVQAAIDACPKCRSLAGKIYKPQEMPRIPIDGCSKPTGCRCCYLPVPP
jgi:hypothetical protein